MVGLLYRLVQISGTRFKRYSHAKRFLPCRAFGSIQCFGDSRCVSFLPSKCFQGPNGLVHQKQYWLELSQRDLLTISEQVRGQRFAAF